MKGEKFIQRILNHERDFRGISLAPLFDFNGDYNLAKEFVKYLRQYRHTFAEAPLMLDDAEMKGVRMRNIEIPYLEATNLNLSECWLRNVKFPNANMDMAHLWGSKLELCNFESSSQVGANYNDTVVLTSNYKGANLDKMICDANTRFDNCNFQNASLREVKAVHAGFAGSDLTGADVAKSDFYFANLSRADLVDLRNLETSRNLHHAITKAARLGSNEYREIIQSRELEELNLPVVVGELVSLPGDEEVLQLIESLDQHTMSDNLGSRNGPSEEALKQSSYLESIFSYEDFQNSLNAIDEKLDTE